MILCDCCDEIVGEAQRCGVGVLVCEAGDGAGQDDIPVSLHSAVILTGEKNNLYPFIFQPGENGGAEFGVTGEQVSDADVPFFGAYDFLWIEHTYRLDEVYIFTNFA